MIRSIRPRGLIGWLAWLCLSLAVTLLLLGFAVVELGLLVVSAAALHREFGSPLGFALFFLGAAPALVLAVAAHEGGHLLAARLAGLTVLSAHVGPVALTRWGSRWRLGWDARQPWLGGRALCLLRGASRGHVALFLAGGPAASFLTAAAALAVALLPVPPLARVWAGQLAVISAFFGVMNLLPFRERCFDSDGLALWRVLTRRP